MGNKAGSISVRDFNHAFQLRRREERRRKSKWDVRLGNPHHFDFDRIVMVYAEDEIEAKALGQAMCSATQVVISASVQHRQTFPHYCECSGCVGPNR